MNSFFAALVLFSLPLITWAAPLGRVPTIEDRNLLLITDFRSDLWSSPYRFKSAPVRIIDGKIRIPLYKNETWVAAIDFQSERFGLGRADVQLGNQQIFVANDMRSESLGLGIRKDLSSGSSISFFSAWATASDRPFASRNSWAESTLLYRSREVGDHRWIVGLNQSNNRGLLNGKPFLYIGWLYDNDEDFVMAVGFPFFRATWGRSDTWRKSVAINYFGSRLEAERNLQDDFVFKTLLDFSVRSFLHDDRVNTDDRLYFQEATLESSIKKQLSDRTSINIGLGYSFDRRLYETRTLYRPNNKSTMVENDAYTRVALEFIL